MSANYVGYFLGRSGPVIANEFYRIGPKPKRGSLKRFGYRQTMEHLTYKKASEIYQARDSGFTKEETIALLDISEMVYDWTMENQDEIGRKIICALDILHPAERHEKPYIEPQSKGI